MSPQVKKRKREEGEEEVEKRSRHSSSPNSSSAYDGFQIPPEISEDIPVIFLPNSEGP